MTTKEQLLAYIRFEGGQEFPDLGFTAPSENVIAVDTLICERPGATGGYDAFGVHWTPAVPSAHYTPNQPPILEDIEDWESVKVPDVSRFDWDGLAEKYRNIDRENNLVAATLLTGPFERTSVLSSFEDCLMNAISEPECYSALIGKIADYKIALIDKLQKAVRPDVINFHDDWGTARSTFMSPTLWRETIKPHIRRIYDAIHERGMLVCQHSCGQISALIPDMIEMGADLWEAQTSCYHLPDLLAQCHGKIRVLSPLLAEVPDGGLPDLPPPPQIDLADLPADGRGYDTPPNFLI